MHFSSSILIPTLRILFLNLKTFYFDIVNPSSSFEDVFLHLNENICVEDGWNYWNFSNQVIYLTLFILCKIQRKLLRILGILALGNMTCLHENARSIMHMALGARMSVQSRWIEEREYLAGRESEVIAHGVRDVREDARRGQAHLLCHLEEAEHGDVHAVAGDV